MSDNRVRVTVRLPQEAYDELCSELASFSTDTSRLQYVTQLYLDCYKDLKRPPLEADNDQCDLELSRLETKDGADTSEFDATEVD